MHSIFLILSYKYHKNTRYILYICYIIIYIIFYFWYLIHFVVEIMNLNIMELVLSGIYVNENNIYYTDL